MEASELLYLSEDSQRSARINVIENEFKQRHDVPCWLEHAESPFKWMKSLEAILLVNSQLPDKMHDYKNQGTDYGFEKYALLLSIMFMKAIKFNEHSSDESSDSDEPETGEESKVSDPDYFPRSLSEVDPEQAYIKCKAALDEMAAHEGDVMYTRIGAAMEHVLLATRAQILYLNGNIAHSKEIAANIRPVEEMSNENLAGIEGIKSKFTLSVYQNVNVPLEASRKAQELDPDFAAWIYLTGKILRRMRRDMKGRICKEELEHFKKAVDKERNPRFIVFLAQAYSEMAFSILKGENRGTQTEAEDMLDKALNLFRECWSLKNDSAAIARRVGNGMMKMKAYHRDLSLTKQALLKAVELSPCSVTYHALGKFHLEFEQDEEKGLECFKKVGSIYGTGEIIRFNVVKSYPDYDPQDHIKYWIDLAVNIVKRDMLYCDIGWYFLVYKKNLFAAVTFFWKVLQKDFNSLKVTKFESFAFCVWKPINMLNLLVNEIKLLNTDAQNCAMRSEKISFLNQFLEKVYEKHPDLRDAIPNAELLNHHKKEMEKYIMNLRKKLNKQHQPFVRNRDITSSNWRVRNSEALDNNEEDGGRMSRSLDRNQEEANQMNSRSQEGMRRGGYSSRFENQGYRDGMRFDRSREGMDRRGANNEREISADFANRRFHQRGRGSSRFDQGEEGSNRNQSRVDGRTVDNRRQYGNNYNNRYDTTFTDWRSRNNE